LRLFIGFFTPLEVEEVKKRVEKLKIEGRWTEEANLHITLKFLGEVERERAEQMASFLKKKLSRVKPFSLSFKGLGIFERGGRPQILWAGVERKEELLSLKRAVEEACAPFGFRREEIEGFKPHITLLRIKKLRRRELLKRLIQEMREKEFGAIRVEKVYLVKSTLTPDGPIYEPIEEFKVGS